LGTSLLRPVLVTGCFRSGTTWVGRTLARSPSLGWVAEPFHIKHRRGVFAAETPSLYTYVCEENEDDYHEAMADTIEARYSWKAGLGDVRSFTDAGLVVKDLGRFFHRRARSQRPVLKDPNALFNAPWLHRRFHADVVVMVRHPAAIMWSQRRLNWRFNFEHLLRQPLLMRDLLESFADDMERLDAQDDPDLAEESALVWRVMYGVAARWRDEHPSWLFVRHEDLSRRPSAVFQNIFDHVGVPLSPEVSSFISKSTSSDNPVSAPHGQAHALNRDSEANVAAWADHLEPSEVERLRELTGDSADLWYDDGDW
jgi:hypothetical protein